MANKSIEKQESDPLQKLNLSLDYTGTMKINCRGEITTLSVMNAVLISKKIKMYVDTCLENKEPIGEFYTDRTLQEFNELVKKYLRPIEDELDCYIIDSPSPKPVTLQDFVKSGGEFDLNKVKYNMIKYGKTYDSGGNYARPLTYSNMEIDITYNFKTIRCYILQNYRGDTTNITILTKNGPRTLEIVGMEFMSDKDFQQYFFD